MAVPAILKMIIRYIAIGMSILVTEYNLYSFLSVRSDFHLINYNYNLNIITDCKYALHRKREKQIMAIVLRFNANTSKLKSASNKTYK